MKYRYEPNVLPRIKAIKFNIFDFFINVLIFSFLITFKSLIICTSMVPFSNALEIPYKNHAIKSKMKLLDKKTMIKSIIKNSLDNIKINFRE